MPGTKFIISDILEKNANQEDRVNGLDIADFLIPFDWREFRMRNEKYESNESVKTSFFVTKNHSDATSNEGLTPSCPAELSQYNLELINYDLSNWKIR